MASSPNKFLQRIKKSLVKTKRAYDLSPTHQRPVEHSPIRRRSQSAPRCGRPLDNAHVHREGGGKSAAGRTAETAYTTQSKPHTGQPSPHSQTDENYVFAQYMDNDLHDLHHANLKNSQGSPVKGLRRRSGYGTNGTGQTAGGETSRHDNKTPNRHRKSQPVPIITGVNINDNCGRSRENGQNVNGRPLIDEEEDVSGYTDSSVEASSPDADAKSRCTSQSSSDQSMKSRSVSESSGSCSSSNSMREIASLDSPSDPSKLTGIKEMDPSDVFIAAPASKLKLQPHQLNIPRLVPLSQRKKNRMNKKSESGDSKGANLMTQSMIETESSGKDAIDVPIVKPTSKDDSCLETSPTKPDVISDVKEKNIVNANCAKLVVTIPSSGNKGVVNNTYSPTPATAPKMAPKVGPATAPKPVNCRPNKSISDPVSAYRSTRPASDAVNGQAVTAAPSSMTTASSVTAPPSCKPPATSAPVCKPPSPTSTTVVTAQVHCEDPAPPEKPPRKKHEELETVAPKSPEFPVPLPPKKKKVPTATLR